MNLKQAIKQATEAATFFHKIFKERGDKTMGKLADDNCQRASWLHELADYRAGRRLPTSFRRATKEREKAMQARIPGALKAKSPAQAIAERLKKEASNA